MAQQTIIETFETTSLVSPPAGLTSTEALRRLDRYGPNVVVETMPPRRRVFLAKFWGPVPWLLEAAIVVQLGLGEYVEAAVVGALLLFNATLGFLQEGRATAAVAALKKQLAPTALVRRDGEWARFAASRLVPGDLITLPLGALVPADARLVSGSITADQSMLTGESVPVDAGPCDLVYAGSLIRRGQAMAEVTATGPRTYFGRAAELVRSAQSVSSEQKAVFGLTRNLAAVNGFIALAVVACGYGMALPSGDLVRLALTALLATIPVALPATFTLSAAFSAQTLARRGVLLTRLSAVHEGAAMDVLCVDKTGTLTRNRLEVIDVFAMPGFDRKRVLHLAVLASAEADLDPIDNAIRAAAANSADRPAGERLVRFVPFDPATRMSEAVATDADGNDLRIVKGAFDAVAGLTASASEPRRIVDDLSARGHRVIAVAAGRPNALRLAGFIAISDPPREDSPALVGELRDLGQGRGQHGDDRAGPRRHRIRRSGRTGRIPTAADLHAEHGGQEMRDRALLGGRLVVDRARRHHPGTHGAAIHNERFSEHVAHNRPRYPVAITQRVADA
jgi:H+-transporting ATPase